MDFGWILDVAPIPVWIQREEEILAVNQQAVRYFEAAAPDEVVGTSAFAFVPEEYEERARHRNRTVLDEGETLEAVEGKTITSQGNVKFGQFALTRVEYEDDPAILVMTQDITERKKQARRLRTFRQAIENAGQAIYWTDLDGTIEYVNPAFEEITGYSRTEAVGENVRILDSGKMSEGFFETLWETVLSGNVWDEEIINQRSDGELYTARQTVAPITEDGEISAFVAIQTDISDQKEKERKLRHYQQAVEGATDMLAAADEEYRYLFANERYREFHGIDGDLDLTTMSIEEVIGAERFDEIKPYLDRVHEGESVSFEMSRTGPKGHERALDIRYYPLVNDAGAVIGDVAAMRDITDRKHREEELSQNKERLSLALEGAELSVWDWNMQTDYVDRDDRWARMLGFEPEEIGDQLADWEEIIHPEDRDRHDRALQSHVQGDAELYEVDYRLWTKDGNWKWVRNIGKVVEWNEAGEPVRSVGIHQDIDAQKRTRERLEQNTELLKVIDRVLRHNLQNDMNVIEGFARSIRHETSGELARQADKIVETSKELMQTVEKERAITKFLSDPKPQRAIDITQVIDSAVSRLSKTYEGATFDVDTPERCNVMARREIGQAIEEILENAIVHNDVEEPAVEVRVSRGEEQVSIRIEDHGPGIPDMERKVLTSETEITPLYHGSGMGLWLVNLIVRQSEGELEFSESESRGSVVTLRLPAS